MENETKPLYYGDRKVTKVEDGYKEGIKRVTVEVKENEEWEAFDLPAWEAEVNLTEQPTDANTPRNERAIYVVTKMLTLLADLDIKVEETSFYVQKLLASMQMNEQQAFLKALGVTDKYDVRLSDWDKLFKK